MLLLRYRHYVEFHWLLELFSRAPAPHQPVTTAPFRKRLTASANAALGCQHADAIAARLPPLATSPDIGYQALAK